MKDQGEEARHGTRKGAPLFPTSDGINGSVFAGRTRGGQMGGDLYILQLTRIMKYFRKCLLEAPGFSADFFPLIMRDACGGCVMQGPESISASPNPKATV